MSPDKAKLPPNFKDMVEDTATLANDAITRTSHLLGSMAKRWMDGLARTDVEEVTKQAGKDLNEFWLKVYETAEENVTPPPTGQGNP